MLLAICVLLTGTVKATESSVLTDNHEEDVKLFGFYALSSYDDFMTYANDGTLSNFHGLSFGWSSINFIDEKAELITTKNSSSSSFYEPEGAREVRELTREAEVSSYLMVYADMTKSPDNFEAFKDREKLINDLVYQSMNYDGITLDFEFVDAENQPDYIQFIKEMHLIMKALHKQLIVCVPVSINFDYYDYEGIFTYADYVVMMAHDYDAKYMNSFVGDDAVMTPQSPVHTIDSDLERIKSSLRNPDYLDKGILQVSFATTQWISDGGYISGQSFHPTYEMLANRMNKELVAGRTYDQIFYRGIQSKNPYLTYQDDEGRNHTIWYEDWKSVRSKIDLVEKYNLGGLSLWRIGTIPNIHSIHENIELNIWEHLIEYIN